MVAAAVSVALAARVTPAVGLPDVPAAEADDIAPHPAAIDAMTATRIGTGMRAVDPGDCVLDA